MKNLKTTIAGLLVGLPGAGDALLKAYEAGSFDGKTGLQLVASIGMILLGYWAKDHNTTGGSVKQ